MAFEVQNSEIETILDPPLVEKKSNIYKSICHGCPVDTKSRESDKQRLIIVSIFCLIFMIAEIVGGVFSNSLAIASDAAHLLMDFGAFMVSLTALWIASKPQTREMSFGFHRAEVLGALISILSIWLLTGILVYMAIQRLLDPHYELNAIVMIYVSVGGIFANVIMALILKFYKREKSEDSTYNQDSINIRSAILHVIGDLLQSVGVCIASIVLYFYPHMKIIDPICTFLFSFIILITTFYIMRDILRVLMEGFPKHLDFTDVKNILYSIPGVVQIHNMRMWSLTLDKIALSAHLVVRKGEKHSEVLKNALKIINKDLEIHEITIQIEETEDIVDQCFICT